MKMLKIHFGNCFHYCGKSDTVSSLFSVNIILVFVVQVKYTYFMFPREYPFFLSLPRRVFITGNSPQKCNNPVLLYIVVYIWHRGRSCFALAQYNDLYFFYKMEPPRPEMDVKWDCKTHL